MIREGRHRLNRESQLFAKRHVRKRTGTDRKFSGYFYEKDTYVSSIACKSLYLQHAGKITKEKSTQPSRE